MSNEKIIDRIKKCMELAGNNPSIEEAANAAAMAQRLMAKHGIELTGITTEDEDEDIESVKLDPIKACKWKYTLASAVAGNFRCKMYLMGRDGIVFYGKSTDAHAAKEVFTILFKLGHKLAMKARRDHKKLYGYGDNIYNSFTIGYVSGIKSILDEQCRAMAIVIQPEVVEAYEEMMKGAGTRNTSVKANIHGKVYNKGVQSGQDAMRQSQSAQIEA